MTIRVNSPSPRALGEKSRVFSLPSVLTQLHSPSFLALLSPLRGGPFERCHLDLLISWPWLCLAIGGTRRDQSSGEKRGEAFLPLSSCHPGSHNSLSCPSTRTASALTGLGQWHSSLTSSAQGAAPAVAAL